MSVSIPKLLLKALTTPIASVSQSFTNGASAWGTLNAPTYPKYMVDNPLPNGFPWGIYPNESHLNPIIDHIFKDHSLPPNQTRTKMRRQRESPDDTISTSNTWFWHRMALRKT